MQTIGITGGTGFIGKHLTTMLALAGYKVVVFTRKMHKVGKQQNVEYSFWSPGEKKFDMHYLHELDAVVHLAGAGVADKRWTKKRKEEIISSRVETTNFLVEKINAHASNCKVFISASAIGFYGPDNSMGNEAPFVEDSLPHNDFLAHTCSLWESASSKARENIRKVILRFGIVLGKDDGVFPQFENPQKIGIVPILGSGNQVMSWIHVDDLCSLIIWILKNDSISGIYNAVAPNPVSQKVISKTIAANKRGMKINVPIPELALKILFGKMSTEILKSTTVSSKKIQEEGFHFKYPQISQAVRAILQ